MQKLALLKSLKIHRQRRSLLLICLLLLSNVLSLYSTVLAVPIGTTNLVMQVTEQMPLDGAVQAAFGGTRASATSQSVMPAILTRTGASVTSPSAAEAILGGTGTSTTSPSAVEAILGGTAPDPLPNDQSLFQDLPNTYQMPTAGNGAGGTGTGAASQAGAVETILGGTAPPSPSQGSAVQAILGTNTPVEYVQAGDTNPQDARALLPVTWMRTTNALQVIANTSPYKGSTTGAAAPYFEALQAMWYYTIGGGWIPKVGWLVAKFMQQTVSGWLGPSIGKFFLAKLIAFKDSPDVSYARDTFSIQMRSWNHMVRDFSYDLLLLFFILSIWRYWNNAVWGNGRLWSAIGRLIVATIAIIAWPEIYHYVIKIANLANDLFIQQLAADPNKIGETVTNWFFNAVAASATNGDLANGTNPPLWVPFTWVIELIINLGIAIAMLVSLFAFFVEKAIQLIIVVMAYVFAPFFLVCLVSPDTDRYASDFLKVFVEATVWNFIWGGLTALLVFTINQGTDNNSPVYALSASISTSVTNNPQNPWFTLLLVLGILQAMLQVPNYISRGHLGAKFGILEMGFAAWMSKRAVSMLWGTNGLYTQLRHAIRDTRSHRWPVELPNVPSTGPIESNVRDGKDFARLNLGASSASSGMVRAGAAPALVGAGSVPGTVTVPGIVGGGGGFGSGSGGSGGYTPLVTAQSGPIPPVRDRTNINTLTGEQSQSAPAATMMQRIRLFGDHTIQQDGGKDDKARFTFDQLGGVDDIIMPKGASEAQKALTMSAASFTNVVDERGNIDPGFQDVLWAAKVRKSLRAGGPLNPFNSYGLYGQVRPTLLDRFALWLDDGKASPAFKDIMSFRNSRWNNKVIAEGVSAYMHGDHSHPIADYWKARRGPYDAAQQIYRLTNPLARAGGVSPERLEVISALTRANVEGTRTTRTAASHQAILRVNTHDRPEYIRSLVRLLQESAAVHFGPSATDESSDRLVNFYDGMMANVQDDHVHAATAITRNHGIQYVTPQNVRDVVAYKQQHYGSSLDKRDFDNSARATQMAANYHDYVGRLRW